MPASPCCSIAYLWTGREEETGRPRLPTRPPAPCLVLLFPTSVPPCWRQPASCSGGKAGRGLPRLVPSQQASKPDAEADARCADRHTGGSTKNATQAVVACIHLSLAARLARPSITRARQGRGKKGKTTRTRTAHMHALSLVKWRMRGCRNGAHGQIAGWPKDQERKNRRWLGARSLALSLSVRYRPRLPACLSAARPWRLLLLPGAARRAL